MYNYRLTLKDNFVSDLVKFEKMVQIMAERRAEVREIRKNIEAKLEVAIAEEKIDEVQALTNEVNEIALAWAEEQKAYNLKLYGGKNDKGEKVGGYCDWVSKDIYKSYVDYIENGNLAKLYATISDLLTKNSVEGSVRDRAVKEFTAELIMLLGAKFVSDNKVLKNKENGTHIYISAMNKRMFKKLVFGAIITIIDRTTIKVENDDKSGITMIEAK